ncbi:hypothetical protein V6N13_059546 [Hibiscus sabdariffa]|uniref:Uncharacterized protein n=1 Tax=Hibiscus sabdariffa TaxID=183260 RepID=A0ABR2GDD4_9ROSI
MAHRNRPKGNLHTTPKSDALAMEGPGQGAQPIVESSISVVATRHLGRCTARNDASATRGLSSRDDAS